MRAVLVCNGSINDYDLIKKHINTDDYIISVDGGARHLRAMGVIPNILIGDFDSANTEDLHYFVDLGVENYKFPAEKDMTDSELAIDKEGLPLYKDSYVIDLEPWPTPREIESVMGKVDLELPDGRWFEVQAEVTLESEEMYTQDDSILEGLEL